MSDMMPTSLVAAVAPRTDYSSKMFLKIEENICCKILCLANCQKSRKKVRIYVDEKTFFQQSGAEVWSHLKVPMIFQYYFKKILKLHTGCVFYPQISFKHFKESREKNSCEVEETWKS